MNQFNKNEAEKKTLIGWCAENWSLYWNLFACRIIDLVFFSLFLVAADFFSGMFSLCGCCLAFDLIYVSIVDRAACGFFVIYMYATRKKLLKLSSIKKWVDLSPFFQFFLLVEFIGSQQTVRFELPVPQRRIRTRNL